MKKRQRDQLVNLSVSLKCPSQDPASDGLFQFHRRPFPVFQKTIRPRNFQHPTRRGGRTGEAGDRPMAGMIFANRPDRYRR